MCVRGTGRSYLAPPRRRPPPPHPPLTHAGTLRGQDTPCVTLIQLGGGTKKHRIKQYKRAASTWTAVPLRKARAPGSPRPVQARSPSTRRRARQASTRPAGKKCARPQSDKKLRGAADKNAGLHDVPDKKLADCADPKKARFSPRLRAEPGDGRAVNLYGPAANKTCAVPFSLTLYSAD